MDGFLAFLDGTVELPLTYIPALFVANRIEGNQFGVVVLIAFLFLEVSLDKGL